MSTRRHVLVTAISMFTVNTSLPQIPRYTHTHIHTHTHTHTHTLSKTCQSNNINLIKCTLSNTLVKQIQNSTQHQLQFKVKQQKVQNHTLKIFIFTIFPHWKICLTWVLNMDSIQDSIRRNHVYRLGSSAAVFNGCKSILLELQLAWGVLYSTISGKQLQRH